MRRPTEEQLQNMSQIVMQTGSDPEMIGDRIRLVNDNNDVR